MSLASRRWGLAEKLKDSTRRHPLRQKDLRRLDWQALHLLGGVFGPQQAAILPQEVHGLKEASAHGAAGDGEAQGVDEVTRALLLLGGEATHSFLYRCFGPLGKCPKTFDQLGKVLADELLSELLLELGLVVVERA